MTFPDFQELCRNRHSIHEFDSKPLGKATVEQLLKVAHLAPSVGNTQPWRFHVVLDLATSLKIVESCCYGNFVPGAGAFIIVTCDKTAKPPIGQILWNPKEMEYSCAIAVDHILLAATAMGLGSCFVSLHHGPVHELLQIPSNEQVIGGVMVGMLRSPQKVGEHHRRPLKEVVKYYE